MHADRQHRRFSPSQAERFFNCAGSTNLLARVPAREESQYALEGTRAHEVLDAALANGVRDAQEAHREYSYLFAEDLDDGENQFYFSVNVALNHIYAILDAHPDAIMVHEFEVDVPLEAAPGEADGYCDVIIFIPSQREIHTIDYKHGAGVTKAARGNQQVMQYAAGAVFGVNFATQCAQLGVALNEETVDTIVATIIQPRAFHPDGMVREVALTPYELFEYIEELEEKVTAALEPDAPLTPGEEQCRFCDARTLCPAREALAVKAIGTQFSQVTDIVTPTLPEVRSLDIERLAMIRQHAPMLRKFLDDVDNHLYELARQGHYIPGAKLVESRPQRKWYGDDEEVLKRLSALTGLPEDKLWERNIMTITSAEKLVVEAFKQRVGRGRKKQAAEDARKSFAYLTLKQSSGNLSLADEDDPRPAVNRNSRDFAQITTAVVPPPTNTGSDT